MVDDLIDCLWQETSDADMAGFEKMMQGMGGGMPGMGAKRTPEEHKQEVEALKAVRYPLNECEQSLSRGAPERNRGAQGDALSIQCMSVCPHAC